MPKVFPQWKEMMIWEEGENRLVFQFDMGIPTVYFPDSATWMAKAPEAYRHRYDEILRQVRNRAKFDNAAFVIQVGAGVWPERVPEKR